MQRAFVFLCLALSMAQPTWAADPALKKFQRVERMLELSGASVMARHMADVMAAQMFTVLETSYPNDDVVRAIAIEEIKKLIAQESAPDSYFMKQLASTFNKHFSDKEIRAIIAFLESPAGRKLQTNQALMARENREIAKAWGKAMVPELMRRIDRALAEQDIKMQ